MGKIIILQGLPASGKSTWAREQVLKFNGKLKRINKDEIREMVDAGKWSGANEKNVIALRDIIIRMYMEQGLDVIIDDTNLHPIHVEHITDIVDKWNSEKLTFPVGTLGSSLLETYEVEINNTFLQVPYKECVKRDLKRPNSVGEKVIRSMYLQFILGVEHVKQVDSLPHVAICDIDGTLALFENKNPYERDFENDKLNSSVDRVLYDYVQLSKISEPFSMVPRTKVVFLSGRSSKYFDVTNEWLKRNCTVSWMDYMLYMRKEKDNRSDMIVKKELFDKYVKDKYYVDFVIDDRLQIIDLWRKMGLFVFNVNQTNEEF